MKIKPLRQDLIDYLVAHKLVSKYQKASALFQSNIRHPSLNVELMEPKWHGTYSFRIDRKYRALFFFARKDLIEVFSVTNHYKK